MKYLSCCEEAAHATPFRRRSRRRRFAGNHPSLSTDRKGKCTSVQAAHKRGVSLSLCASSGLSSLSKLRQARLQRTEQRLASTVRHDRPALARWLRKKNDQNMPNVQEVNSNLTEPGDRPPSTVSGKCPTLRGPTAAALPALARAPRLARSAADTCELSASRAPLPEGRSAIAGALSFH